MGVSGAANAPNFDQPGAGLNRSAAFGTVRPAGGNLAMRGSARPDFRPAGKIFLTLEGTLRDRP
jgi:hypothetical protein